MEIENREKIKKVLELPKINPQITPTSHFFSQEKQLIKNSDQVNSTSYQKTFNETTKNSKIDTVATKATLYYFRHQVPTPLKKKNSLNEGRIFMKNFSFSNVRKTEHDSWKKEEMNKIKESRLTKDFTKNLILHDKNKRKYVSLDTTIKSNLMQLDFNKLNSTQIQTLPKHEIGEEKLKENLKEYIGIYKFPIDYKEVNFEVPKSSFIEFELIKTHMSNFKQIYENSCLI